MTKWKKFFMMRDFQKGLHTRVKVQAVKEKSTIEAIVIKALEQHLKKVGG
jgi:predicted HicB family RNase H-like nuclease